MSGYDENSKIKNFVEWSDAFFSETNHDAKSTDELLIAGRVNDSVNMDDENVAASERSKDKSVRLNFYRVTQNL